MNDTVTPWHVETASTRYRNKKLYQLRLRDDENHIVCFGFGRNLTAAYLRLSKHAQGTYCPLRDWSRAPRHKYDPPVISVGELPLALLALERYLDNK